MRKQLVIASVAFLAACAPGANGELRGLAEEVAPAERIMLECNWGTNWGADSGSYYGCFYFVPGGLSDVGEAVLDRLAARRFTVTCRTDSHSIELIGSRGGTMFYAGILANGFVHGRDDASEVDIPPGHVLVEVAAIEDDAGVQPGRLCATP